MKLYELFESSVECEVCYFDEDGNELLDEAAVRQYKKIGQNIVKKFRCLSGPKKGKLVSSPTGCATRKDPKKVRRGRIVMRQKGATIRRKGKIAKKKASAQQVIKINKRLSGK